MTRTQGNHNACLTGLYLRWRRWRWHCGITRTCRARKRTHWTCSYAKSDRISHTTPTRLATTAEAATATAAAVASAAVAAEAGAAAAVAARAAVATTPDGAVIARRLELRDGKHRRMLGYTTNTTTATVVAKVRSHEMRSFPPFRVSRLGELRLTAYGRQKRAAWHTSATVHGRERLERASTDRCVHHHVEVKAPARLQ